MKTLFQQVCLKYPPSLKAFVGLHLLDELQCFFPDFPASVVRSSRVKGWPLHSPEQPRLRGRVSSALAVGPAEPQDSEGPQLPPLLLEDWAAAPVITSGPESKKKKQKLQAPVDGLTSHVSILGQRDKKKKKKKGKTIHQVPGNSPSALCVKCFPIACPMWIHLKGEKWAPQTHLFMTRIGLKGSSRLLSSPRWLNSATP